MTILDGFLMLASMLLILAMVRWHSRDIAKLEVAAEQLHHRLALLENERKPQ